MSSGTVDRMKENHHQVMAPPRNSNGNGAVRTNFSSAVGLHRNPNTEHNPDNYDDLESEFSPQLFRQLERHLPSNLLNVPRDTKALLMRNILLRYSPAGEHSEVKKHKEYKQKVMSRYKPLYPELYNMHPATFFVPSFLKAISENKEESFRNIITEPSPGVLTFEMLQPQFCRMLLDEVDHFESRFRDSEIKITRPNTMNRYGAVLDDFGLEKMLDKLIEDFIRPISKIFFPEVGGGTLDSHHGFVVEYGADRDVDLGFHVDDSEVTLNVCLGEQFSGGELFFRGVRCEKHVNTESKPEEIFDYSHVPGRAVIHRGRHRHGARATTEGHRVNLLLWCRSSIFREIRRHGTQSPGWCGVCQRQKKDRLRRSIAVTEQELVKKRRSSSVDDS